MAKIIPDRPDTWPKPGQLYRPVENDIVTFGYDGTNKNRCCWFKEPSKIHGEILVFPDRPFDAFPCTPEGWIRVEDGLPAFNESVFIVYKATNCEPIKIQAKLRSVTTSGIECWEMPGLDIADEGQVIAWMPEPPMPEGNSDED